MLTRVIYKGDGTRTDFEIPFPYLDRTHVRVRVNMVVQFLENDYHFLDDGRIRFRVAPLADDAVEIYRATEEANPLVQYQDGSVLTERELNLAVLQNLYLIQETKDLWQSLIDGRLAEILNNGTTAGEIVDAVVQEILESRLLADLQQRITDIDTNASTILSHSVDIASLRQRIEELTQVSLGELDTLIATERNERIEGDTALAETLSLIGARSSDSTAFILNTDTVKVSPTESLGQSLQAILTRVEDVEAGIATEANVRAAADSAFAGQITTLQSRMGNAEALITSNYNTLAAADTALGNRIDGILATVNDNRALILQEQTARADGDSALASSISTLQSQVNGNTASIQTLQTVTDGLKAQYMVKTDVNGYVAGFGLYNTGATSEFIVLADRFAIVAPGKTPVVPFAVDANGVYMDNAYIRNLSVDKITGGNIGSQWNMYSGGGRIVLDTGTHMKVIGVGFGADRDLVEWYGPKMNIGACSKANGITWTDMRGNAYFGGSLRAGTLYNAARTTNTAHNAEVVLGPFATNGNPKSVVVSYSLTQRNTCTVLGSSGYTYAGGTPSATIRLYRKINNGPETLIATWTYTGTWSINNGFDDPDTAVQDISGSNTYTDNTGASQITYRAVIASRTLADFTHPNGTQTVNLTQSLGIVSTEE